MQAIILAGGEGIRLGKSNTIPKCLLKVGKKTILEHNLSQLPQEVGEVIVVVESLKNQVKENIGKNFGGRRITYVEQPERLGTGHALFICKDFVHDGKFIVLMGDNLYIKKDMENCLRHRLCILAQKVETPDRFGVIELRSGILKNVVESPKLPTNTLVNCGLYVLDKRIFDYRLVSIGGGEYGLPQTIVKMAMNYPVEIEHASFWMPVNTIQDLKQADKYLKRLYL